MMIKLQSSNQSFLNEDVVLCHGFIKSSCILVIDGISDLLLSLNNAHLSVLNIAFLCPLEVTNLLAMPSLNGNQHLTRWASCQPSQGQEGCSLTSMALFA